MEAFIVRALLHTWDPLALLHLLRHDNMHNRRWALGDTPHR